MQPKVILWGKLRDQQKRRFLSRLKQGYEALQDERILDFMIHRCGDFDAATPGRTRLRPERVQAFKREWQGSMSDQRLPEVYGTEIRSTTLGGGRRCTSGAIA